MHFTSQVKGDFARMDATREVLLECIASVPRDLGLHANEFNVVIFDLETIAAGEEERPESGGSDGGASAPAESGSAHTSTERAAAPALVDAGQAGGNRGGSSAAVAESNPAAMAPKRARAVIHLQFFNADEDFEVLLCADSGGVCDEARARIYSRYCGSSASRI